MPAASQDGVNYTYTPAATDPDAGDTLTWKLKKGPAGATIDSTTGALNWTPSTTDVGKDIEFEIEVCDDKGNCDTQTWKTQPKQANTPPSIVSNPSVFVYAGEENTYSPKVQDPDVGDTHTWSLKKGPTNLKQCKKSKNV